MDTFLGLNAKAYVNTGTYEAETWVEVDMARNVTLAMERGEWDASHRGVQWKLMVAVLNTASVEFDLLYQPGNEANDALKDAFLANTPIEMAVMDQDINNAGAEGLRATMQVFNFSREEPLEEGLANKVTVKPTLSDNDPEWIFI